MASKKSKKSVFYYGLVVIVLLSSRPFADTWTSGTNLTYLSSSSVKVGIGLSSPLWPFHIVASGAKTTTYREVLFSNTATSSTASINKIGLEISSTGNWNGTSASNIGLFISSVTGGTNNYDAIFNGGGKVGIGTTAPTARLEINPTLTATPPASLIGQKIGINQASYGFTTWTGTYIAGPSGSGTITNKYALVTEPGAGYVGIGTTTPGAPLDLRASIGKFVIQNDFGGLLQKSVELGSTSSNPSTPYGALKLFNYNNSTGLMDMSVCLNTDMSTNSWMNVNKLGIGTTTPVAQLHINPTVNTILNYTNFKNGIEYNGTSAMENWYGNYIAAPTGSGTITNKYAFVTEPNAGYVGIGTTAPQELLHISSTTLEDVRIKINSPNNNGSSAGIVLSQNNGDYAEFYVEKGINGNNCRIGTTSSGTRLYLTTNDEKRVVITKDGCVGIGGDYSSSVNDPNEKLEVDGTVKANSFRVGDWTIKTPDYVFDKGYNLKSLTEVENFVMANKHLPDVPSAKEMKKNGLDLAQMNMTLLKKVEELTLYTIEQNKKVENQDKKIETQNRLIERQQKQIDLLMKKLQ